MSKNSPGRKMARSDFIIFRFDENASLSLFSVHGLFMPTYFNICQKDSSWKTFKTSRKAKIQKFKKNKQTNKKTSLLRLCTFKKDLQKPFLSPTLLPTLLCAGIYLSVPEFSCLKQKIFYNQKLSLYTSVYSKFSPSTDAAPSPNAHAKHTRVQV